MDAAQTIREAVDRVSTLRLSAQSTPELQRAITAIKSFQSRRFALTYATELRSGPFQGASRFFLEELYSDKDYSTRDAQFSRIAGTLQSIFPKAVIQTAVSLAELHALTEELDHAMGLALLTFEAHFGNDEVRLYAQAWHIVGRRADRELQLNTVLGVGQELARLTRTSGLKMMLRVMRRPAQVAGLSDLQHFLELGFDTFGELSRNRDNVVGFLEMIRHRESRLIDLLFANRYNRF